MSHAQKVSTCLWYDRQAEEAANFYVSLLPSSRVTGVSRYGAEGPMPEGTALIVGFELAGTAFIALNGGPHFTFTEASSMVVTCETQTEIDALWSQLTSDGGSEAQCFWLKDRYGLSWQIVPSRLHEWMTSDDTLAAARVMSVVMASVKPEIARLEAAFRGN